MLRRLGFQPPIPSLARECNRLVDQRPGFPRLTCALQCPRARQQRDRAGGRGKARDAEHLRPQLRRDGERALQIQDLEGGPVGLYGDLAIVTRGGPPARHDDVVELERQCPALPRAVAPVQCLDCGVGSKCRENLSVALLGRALVGMATRAQFFTRVFVDADVHPEVDLVELVAVLAGRGPRAQQALVHQRLDRIHRRRRVGPRGQVDHLLGRVEREASFEHRAVGERRLLPRDEQVPRPVDRGPQRGLAVRHTPRTAEERKAVAHALDDL